MNPTDIAEMIAMHAVATLLVVTVVMMAVAAVLWRLIERGGTKWLNNAAAWWSARSQHTLAKRLRSVPLIGPTIQVTVRHTMGAGRYLGAHAVVSFMVAIGAMTSFVAIADEIGVGESLAQFDLALSKALSRHLSDTVLQACAAVTHLGDGGVLIAVAGGVASVLFWRREALLAWAWLVATVGGGLMNALLKLWFARVRPVPAHEFTRVEGWSFPSGHACGSMLVYGLLGYLIVRHTRAALHIPVAAVTVLLVIVIGASRVLLQVHYLSDVLAGWATATVWVSLCIAGLEAVRLRSLSDPVRADAAP